MSRFWTPRREAALRKLWPTMSASEVARAIGPNCTRGMVAGNANRLGLEISQEERLRRCGHGMRTQRSPLPRDVVVVECDGMSG
jgi:hypothetical protein